MCVLIVLASFSYPFGRSPRARQVLPMVTSLILWLVDVSDWVALKAVCVLEYSISFPGEFCSALTNHQIWI